MTIFSERLKWLREKKGLTQKEIGEKLGISGPSYSKYEYALREPNLDTLAKLPEILGESVDFLLGVTDFDKKNESDYRQVTDYVTRISMLADQFMDNQDEIFDLDPKVKEQKIFTGNLLKSELQKFKEAHIAYSKIVITALEITPLISEETLELIKKLTEFINRQSNDSS